MKVNSLESAYVVEEVQVVKGAEGSKETIIAGGMPDISMRLIGHGILFKGF
jgi:hypothetical protein